MDIRDLQLVIGIAETGSLSAAARKLNLTQPALSASLRRLEEELGVKLVHRHSRGSELTEEGQYVLERAYGICNDVTDIRSVVQNLADEPTGLVRIGLPTTVAGKLIPEFLPLLRARYPKIKLHIVEAMSGVLAELLQLGRLDIAILFDIQPMAGLRSEPILRERHHLLVPPGHELARKDVVRLEEMARLGLLLPSQGNSIRRYIDQTCVAEGLSLNILGDIDSLNGLINLVESGYPTILPLYLLTDRIREKRIVAIPITRPQLEWTVHLASRHDATRPRANLTASRLLIDVATQLVKSGKWPGQLVGAS
ncbi:LysR family transcriptional regulator [Indioceanicola profundi]|uniref:LysR family transcriptional regulator n=1 Tax=Indioceanicola profundi TaxID=2220096 RepID=UPI0013C496A9|nr:LysR family transcriptional regulator [Indioceanicola profundi]